MAATICNRGGFFGLKEDLISMSIFWNRTLIGALCVSLSLAICFGVAPMFNRSAARTDEIVRAKQEIRAGEMITADMVSVVEVGGYNLPDGLIRQLDTVLGRYATADLFAGDYIQAPPKLPSK